MVTDWVVDTPPQLIVYVDCELTVTDWLPERLEALRPGPDSVQLETPVALQVTVEEPPGLTLVGDAVIETFAGITVTVSTSWAEPPGQRAWHSAA